MALRNAFEDMATEATQQELVALLTQLLTQALTQAQGAVNTQHQHDMYPNRALQYARTPQDQMRVVVDTGYAYNYGTYMWAASVYTPYYATGAPNSMDQRHQQSEASMQNFNIVRTQRWIIT